jgi:hypothetical protein
VENMSFMDGDPDPSVDARSTGMKTITTPAQHKAADGQRIVDMFPKRETLSQAAKALAPHPHIVCNSWVGPKIKGVIHC